MLCAVMMAQAQINEGLHWYNGQITFTAHNIENKNVLMEAMDEGEEHEFILRYVKEVNPSHQVYRTDNATHDHVNLYGVGSTMRHKKSEGLDVLCFYDDKDRLAAVISGEKEWDAEKLNKSRWLSQFIGEYTTEEENKVEQCFNWTWESLQDVSRSQYTIAEWEDMIYAELAAQRPVISFITVRKWYFHFR